MRIWRKGGVTGKVIARVVEADALLHASGGTVYPVPRTFRGNY